MTRTATRLFLVRHGATAGADGLAVGQVDLPLSAPGAESLRRLAATWRGPAPDRLYASDLQRAVASAEILDRRWGLGIETDPRLREMDFGDWDGLTWEEIRERDTRRFRTWRKLWWHSGPPGGESVELLAVRARRWLDQVLVDLAGGTVVAVAHGGSIRTLLGSVLGLPLDKVFHLRLDHGRASGLETTWRGVEVSFVNVETFPGPGSETGGGPHSAS